MYGSPLAYFYIWTQKNTEENKTSVEEVTGSTSPSCSLNFANLESNKKFSQMHIQSEDVVEQTTTTSEVVSFIDAASVVHDEGYSPNSVISAGGSSDTSLGSFLSRPTLIASDDWNTSDVVGVLGSIEPWYTFLVNSIISNKLQNYSFLRAKLCMKFVVNGTPFHFGLMRVAYEPSVNVANTGFRKSKIRTNATSDYPLLTPYSQLPGSWLYPSMNAGAELHVPFFLHKSWLDLNSAAEAKSMGKLTFFVAIPLDVATASASTTIKIQTYAWLEDVELSGSTHNLLLQAGTEYDGPVSYPASAIARVSRALEQIPFISKFARATTIAASGLAQVASIFGFTNVPVISDIHAYTPMPFSHLASSEISTAVQKLTLDPKQELSIDPSLHGLSGVDEMCIKHIVSQPTVLHVFDWTTANNQDDVLCNFLVNPSQYDYALVNGAGAVLRSRRIYHTWLSYLAQIFTHWRGDIIFDVEVVCTKFHKGRLQISWDPNPLVTNVQVSSNECVTAILDIGETTRASIRVPFHQAYEWLLTRGITDPSWAINTALGVSKKFDNGALIVSVLNPLISPVSPQEVHILVKVRGADNFEFANPQDSFGTTTFAPPPSFFAVQSGEELDSVDMKAVEIPFGDYGSQHVNRYDLNIGERVVSLRALLRRYSLYDVSIVPASAATRFFRYFKSYTRLPTMFGFDPNGLSLAGGLVVAASFPYSTKPTHPITLISMMYGGMRGGVNYVINTGDGFTGTLVDTRVQRLNTNTFTGARNGGQYVTTTAAMTNGQTLQSLNEGYPAYTAGGTFTNGNTNGALSAYYPNMSGTNFYYPDPTYSVVGNPDDQTDRECMLLELVGRQSATVTTSSSITLTTYAAAGVDFSNLWLLCCPTLDYYTSFPVVS